MPAEVQRGLSSAPPSEHSRAADDPSLSSSDDEWDCDDEGPDLDPTTVPEGHTPLEKDLAQMFEDETQAPIILALGQKGGGKTFRVMTMIKWLLDNDIFDRYLLILPTYRFEAVGSYSWLQAYKEKVFVGEQYTPDLSQALLDRRDDKKKPHEVPRTFLWLDDAGVNEQFKNDRAFVSLISIARHKRLSVCLCYHSLTSGQTLSPFLRQNITHTWLFRVTNENLLESIFQELISMTACYQNFRTFKAIYNQYTKSEFNPSTGVLDKNYNALCINNSLGVIDWKLAEWYRKQSQFMLVFTTHMKKLLVEHKLPVPGAHLQVVTTTLCSNLKKTEWKKDIPIPIAQPTPKELKRGSSPEKKRPKKESEVGSLNQT